MNLSGLALLSDREIECLRLVARLHTDKEIARELNIEPSTVKTLIGRAMRKLDVNTRAAAARALAQHEGRPPQWGTPQDGGQREALVQNISSPPAPPDGAGTGSFREARAQIAVGTQPDSLIPQGVGRTLRASALVRLALIVGITMLLVLVAIAAVPLTDAVERVAIRFEPGRHSR